MAGRREQKEQLRREREQREAASKAGQRRRQLIGYGAGGAFALVVVVAAMALLDGGGDGGSASGNVLPDGGSHPEPRDVASVEAAAREAGCELKSYKARSRRHISDLSEQVRYASKPPTSGAHYPPPAADDGAYETAPDVRKLVHTMEHGRVIVWFKRGLSADRRAALKAYFDDDPYQMVLTPDTTGMKYQVAATAWNRDPEPNGTGRLLGCPRYDDDVFTALEAFKDEHRGRGPELVP